ncbi:MAG: class I SAM-dependent methyltransferase [Proteobacteria bacterium]|nr:class I SAM-dependent methyltransferase [Pseudomonadota bacterium]
MSDVVDYENIWNKVWGDMQKYGPIHRHHRRIFGQMIATLPCDQMRMIADIGCGEGSNLLYLKRFFPDAQFFGFDLSETALDKASANVDATLKVLNIEKEPLPCSFDFVICSDVIEHIQDDMAVLRHIYQATVQYALIATVQGRMRPFETTIAGHVRSYAEGELQEKLEAVGFKVLRTVEWGFPLYSPLYRDLFSNVPAAEQTSHGRYGIGKRLLCQVLYGLFCLNSSHRGDLVFALVQP